MSEPQPRDGEHVHEPPPDDDYAVSPLELFFDLVFVFAFTQVTDLLAHDLSWTGMAKGVAVLLVVWWAWVGYSWLTNSVRVDDMIPARIVIFAAMGATLVMALAIPESFGDDGVMFGISYFLVTAMFVLLYFVATRDRPEMHRAVGLLAPGVLAAPVLIVIASYFDQGFVRATLWTVAIVVTVVSPIVVGMQAWHVRPAHFAERHGLIIIIALGESLVALGASAAEEPKTFTVVGASIVGLAVVACLWWIYFDVVSRAAEIALRKAEGLARNTMARDVYSYLHFFMVLGVVFIALGLHEALLGVDEPLEPIASVGLFGGAALYLLGHIGVRLRLVGGVNLWRLGLAILMLCLIPLGTVVPADVSVLVLLTLLIAAITQALVTYRDNRHQVRYHSH